MSQPDINVVKDYFINLQTQICDTIGNIDADPAYSDGESGVAGGFSLEEIFPDTGGYSRPRVLDNGPVIERAAVQFSHSVGSQLPPAATERNPELAGKGFEATAISLIMHPRNPYAPTMHANLRFFIVNNDFWYFGGGFDLTPYYGNEDDVRHWHQQAKEACESFGSEVYPELKKQCDDYFFLSHRQEPRGIGGLFFDDWTRGGFQQSFDFVRSVGDHILPAYEPILRARCTTSYGERQRDFQLYRRGRYAEFNLAIDRGTRYGIQSGRRIESVLASMPPLAIWRYNWQPDPGTEESELYDKFLVPKDWI